MEVEEEQQEESSMNERSPENKKRTAKRSILESQRRTAILILSSLSFSSSSCLEIVLELKKTKNERMRRKMKKTDEKRAAVIKASCLIHSFSINPMKKSNEKELLELVLSRHCASQKFIELLRQFVHVSFDFFLFWMFSFSLIASFFLDVSSKAEIACNWC